MRRSWCGGRQQPSLVAARRWLGPAGDAWTGAINAAGGARAGATHVGDGGWGVGGGTAGATSTKRDEQQAGPAAGATSSRRVGAG